MSKENANHAVRIVIASAAVILFAFGTFFDLPAEQAVYHPNQPAALVFTVLGYYLFFGPFEFLTGALCRQLMHLAATRTKRILSLAICSYIGISTAVLGGMGLVSDSVLGLLFPEVEFTFLRCFLIGVIVFCPLVALGMLLNGDRADKATVYCLILLLGILTLSFFGQVLFTSVTNRPRYRITLLGLEELTFRPWYTPLRDAAQLSARYALKSDALRSFFSGHAMDAVLNLAIFPAFALVFPGLQTKERFLKLAALLLIPPIAFSRMVLGAHYLSDVSAGMLCGLLLVILYEAGAASVKARHRSEPCRD